MLQRPATSHSQKINEQIRKELLPRIDKLKQYMNLGLVPNSTESRIIIPCLEKTFGFKTNQYTANKPFLEGFITRLEFNGFVRKCNKIVEEEVIKKTKKENQSFFGIISTLLKTSIVIALLTFFLLASIVFFTIQDSTSNIILILAGILLASASTIAVVCPIVLYNSKYQGVDYQDTIKNQLHLLVQQQNDYLLKKGKKHLRWQIQKNFFWIELNIDDSLYEENKQQKISEEEENISANQFINNKKTGGKSGKNFDQLVND